MLLQLQQQAALLITQKINRKRLDSLFFRNFICYLNMQLNHFLSDMISDIIYPVSLRGVRMKKGDIVKGRITSIKPFGAFVKIDESVDGLIHISEISERFVRSIEDYLSVGDFVTLEVISVSSDNKLSLRFKSQNKNGRKKHEKVQLEQGFKPLAEKLDHWVKKYFEER